MVDEIFPLLLKQRIEDMRVILNEMANEGIGKETVELSQELDILITEFMITQIEIHNK